MTNLLISIMFVSFAIILLYCTKDIISPPMILSFAWALPFIWLVAGEGIGKGGYDIGIIGFYFFFGVVVFCLGYFLQNKRIYRATEKFEITDSRIMTPLFKLFIILEFVITIIWLFKVYQFVMGHFQYNFWFTYKWNVSMGNFSDGTVIEYLRTAARVFSCITFIQFLTHNHHKKDTKWFVLQLCITLILNLLGQGRGGIFSFIIPMGIIFVMMRRKSNFQTIKIGCRVLLLLIIIFVVYANMKTPYESARNTPIMTTLENYLCGAVVAFEKWVSVQNKEYGYGIYTFRFLLAIIQALGFNVKVVPMAEEYVTNINGNIGNVYTFYKWYANDFGLIYAMLWQFIVGMIHGYITRKTYRIRSEKWLLIYALSFYPLVMQFFMDEYITMLSSWIQVFFWIWLILNTKLFYRANLREESIPGGKLYV